MSEKKDLITIEIYYAKIKNPIGYTYLHLNDLNNEKNEEETFVPTTEISITDQIFELREKLLKEFFPPEYEELDTYYLKIKNISPRIYKDFGKQFFDLNYIPFTYDNYPISKFTNGGRIFKFEIELIYRKDYEIPPKKYIEKPKKTVEKKEEKKETKTEEIKVIEKKEETKINIEDEKLELLKKEEEIRKKLVNEKHESLMKEFEIIPIESSFLKKTYRNSEKFNQFLDNNLISDPNNPNKLITFRECLKIPVYW